MHVGERGQDVAILEIEAVRAVLVDDVVAGQVQGRRLRVRHDDDFAPQVNVADVGRERIEPGALAGLRACFVQGGWRVSGEGREARASLERRTRLAPYSLVPGSSSAGTSTDRRIVSPVRVMEDMCVLNA